MYTYSELKNLNKKQLQELCKLLEIGYKNTDSANILIDRILDKQFEEEF